MEPQMQPLAIAALSSGVVMIFGVAVTLILTRHDMKADRVTINRWIRNGSIPLAAAGLALGVISRSSGQSVTTHDTLYGVAIAMFLAALLCALIGAASASRQRPGSGHA
jgi:ABC-type sulfate transport system permease component